MCTSILAGKEATEDNVLIVARDEDFDLNNWNKYLKPMRDPQYITDENCVKKGNWRMGNGLTVPVPQKALRYCSSPDGAGSQEAACSIGEHYFFEERGFNEKGLMISATNSMEINAEANDADHVVEIGIEESIILTLILPQAESALEAVRLLGYYVEKYGAMEANGISIADKEEIWYMEIGSGHHWIAVRVPQNCYLAVSNCMRIRGVDLDDTKNVQYSRGLYEFIVEANLLDNPDRNNLDFAGAFGYSGKSGTDPDPYYNVDRLWLAQYLLTPSLKQEIHQEEYPLFLVPDQKITVKKVAEILRAGYEGTPLEKVSKRPIGMVRTAESHIMVMDSSMPEGFEGMIWQTIGTPLGCPFMPLYPFMEEIPEEYALGDSVYDKDSAYWKFRSLFSIASGMGALEEVSSMWKQYEEELFKQFEAYRCFFHEWPEECVEQAKAYAQNYSMGVLLRTAEKAERKQKELLTRMSAEIQSV